MFRQQVLHRGSDRSKFGPFSDHGTVDVGHLPTLRCDHGDDLLEQFDAVRSAPTLVVVGEMAPQVTQPGGTQQGLADRV